MMRSEIERQIKEVITIAYPDAASLSFDVAVPEQSGHGDYASNVAMVLARALKRNPVEIAEQIAEKLSGQDALFRVEVAKPGFLNFFITDKQLFSGLDTLVQNHESLGTSNAGKDKTVIIDYFQLNIAKRPHIGHIRSAIIGDALKRMLLSQGYHAVSDTHVGDWGTQFGILLLGYKEAGADLHMQDITQDPFGQLEEIYLAENARIKENSQRRELAKEEFAKLERGDPENRKIWQWMVEISMRNLEANTARLGLLPFDEHRGESFYENKMEPIWKGALASGVAKRTEDGAIIVDLTGEGLDEAILIKSDGASTYLLRDLATIRYRKEHWNFWKNLYVVDVRQSHHFRQVFRVAELLGFEGVGQSEHVEYGFMKLPSGSAVSTRGGDAISLEKVLDEAIMRATRVIAEKNPNLNRALEIAFIVGLSALKYFDLSHHRTSDITFEWDRALSFEGNTGPYVQYAHARLKSILRKSGVNAYQVPSAIGLDPAERNLATALLRFPEAIEDGLAIWSPHILAAYLYELATRSNEFYHARQILTEADEARKQFLLALVFATAATLKKGLSLLGIDAPEEM